MRLRLGFGAFAFTLIELLVALAVIAILAVLLLPVTNEPRRPGQKIRAKMEISMIVSAIRAYEAEYSRFPVSSNVVSFAAATKGDFTFGSAALKATLGPGTWTADNR